MEVGKYYFYFRINITVYTVTFKHLNLTKQMINQNYTAHYYSIRSCPSEQIIIFKYQVI